MIGRGRAGIVALGLLLISVAPSRAVEVGEPLPEFSLRTFDGGSYSRASLLGKPALLVFWNTWCPNCLRDLPEIDRLARELAPEGLMVLAVNTAINDSERKARAYWRKHGHAFPTGFDRYFEIGTAFAVRGVPTVFVVDSRGTVRFKGAQVPADLGDRLPELNTP